VRIQGLTYPHLNHLPHLHALFYKRMPVLWAFFFRWAKCCLDRASQQHGTCTSDGTDNLHPSSIYFNKAVSHLVRSSQGERMGFIQLVEAGDVFVSGFRYTMAPNMERRELNSAVIFCTRILQSSSSQSRTHCRAGYK